MSILDGTAAEQHVLFSDANRRLQLIVAGVDIRAGATLLSDAVIPRPLVERRVRLLRLFADLASSGCFGRRHYPPRRHNSRWRFVLQALDGALEQLPQRDIAIALFGAPRVERDWSGRSAIRDQIRRAVRRGRSLMNGGYLGLLS